MEYFTDLVFLFLAGSILGWIIELFFRRFISTANPERLWINPGFLVGPFLPLYGFVMVALYVMVEIDISFVENIILRRILLFILMALIITSIEFVAGLIFIKGMKVKLWDYSEEKGNIMGIICPRFALIWLCMSAIYYYLIHPPVQKLVVWASNQIAFSFVVGFVLGIFIIDVGFSMNIMAHIRNFAKENEIVVMYEKFKQAVRERNQQQKEKIHYIFAIYSETRIFEESLKQHYEKIQERVKKYREEIKNRK